MKHNRARKDRDVQEVTPSKRSTSPSTLRKLPEKRLALVETVFANPEATDDEISEALDLLLNWASSFDPQTAANAITMVVARRSMHKDPRFSSAIANVLAVLELDAEQATQGLSLGPERWDKLHPSSVGAEADRDCQASMLLVPELCAKVLQSLKVVNQVPSERLMCYLAYSALKGVGSFSRTEVVNTVGVIWSFRGCSEELMRGVCFRAVEQIDLLSIQDRAQLAYNLDVMNAQGIFRDGIEGAAFSRVAADLVEIA